MDGQAMRLETGKYLLDEIQTALTTKNLQLDESTLDPFFSPLSPKSLGLEVDPILKKRRMDAVRNLQSNEPFRPFMELILNSIDYAQGSEPKIDIRVSQLKEGGWQVTVQDKPIGQGMDGESLLNKYFDPYASGSAASRKTTEGNWKKGFMGVGAQQQISLLRHPGDEIWISSSKNETLSLVRLNLAGDKVQMTLGGLKDRENLRKGVSQIIRLSKETCQELAFTPKNFAAYLRERLFSLEGIEIGLSVTEDKQYQDEIISGVSPSFGKALERSKRELVGERDEFVSGRTRTRYRLAEVSSKNVRVIRAPETDVVLSEALSDESFVYLNVLGIRVGDPVIVQGKNLPQTIDLRFNKPIETITEGRRATGLTEETLVSMIGVISSLEGSHPTGDEKEDARIALSVLTALTPLYRRYEEMNRWRIFEGKSLEKALEKGFAEAIGRAKKAGIVILPDSILPVVNSSGNKAIFIPGNFLNNKDIAANLESLGIARIEHLVPPAFLLKLPFEKPIWVSPDGLLFVNENLFPRIGEKEAVKIKAIIANRKASGAIRGDWQISSEKNIPDSQKDLPSGNPAPDDFESKRPEVEKQSREYFVVLKAEWEGLTFEQKKQRLNGWIDLMYVKSGFKYQYEVVRDKDGYYYAHSPYYDNQRQRIRHWFDLEEHELDLVWGVIKDGYKKNIFKFFPTEITTQGDLLKSINSFQFPVTEGFAFHFLSDNIYTLNPVKVTHPAVLDLTARQNLHLFDWKRVVWLISEHSQDLADKMGLSGATREKFLAGWNSREDLEEIIRKLAKESFLRQYLLMFPDQIDYYLEIINKYGLDILDGNFITQDDLKDGTWFSPRELATKILPFIASANIDLETIHILNYLNKDKPPIYLTADEKILWQLANTDFDVRQTDPIVQEEKGMGINPAYLPLIKFSGGQDQVISAKNLDSVLNSFEFPPDKIAARKRELLHPILHLDPNPGSSYFEILKNAWQAIDRGINLPPIRRRIEIEDFYEIGEDFHYGFSIRDHVGINPREALFKLIVPGFGEGIHGLHFLTVLKDADIITVTTSQGAIRGTITLETLKDSSGQPVDFTLHYFEDENTEKFTGTIVDVKRKIKTEELQVEAAIFRSKISDFGANISPERAQIILNGDKINSGVTLFSGRIEVLGEIEVKPASGGRAEVSIDSIPLKSHDLKSQIETSSIPETLKELLLGSGFIVNIKNPEVQLTRDNSGFIDPSGANRLIDAFFSENAVSIIGAMLKSGELKFESVLPEETWYDSFYADSFAMTNPAFFEKADLSDRQKLQGYLLTRPVFNLRGCMHSLSQVISLSLKGVLTDDDLKKLPVKITNRLFSRHIKKETEEALFEPGITLPDDVGSFLNQLTQAAETAAGLTGTDPQVFMHRGTVRGIENRAYHEKGSYYSWNKSVLQEIRRAIKGDLNALASLLETAAHEAVHEVQSDGRQEIFAHDRKFYDQVERAIINIVIA